MGGVNGSGLRGGSRLMGEKGCGGDLGIENLFILILLL